MLLDAISNPTPENLAEASRVALTRLTDEERYTALGVILRTFPADIAEGRVQAVFKAYGWPDPLPQEDLLPQAREWAFWANKHEIGAMLRACCESLEGERLARFKQYVGEL
ncbi:hypothetical protein [Roseivivax jejudonensis]|nr:hypothetical protein [Roseivivax jejudonensis]